MSVFDLSKVFSSPNSVLLHLLLLEIALIYVLNLGVFLEGDSKIGNKERD